MKKAVVKWPIPILSIGVFILFMGVLLVAMPVLFTEIPPSESYLTYLGVIVALVGIGMIIFAVVRKPTGSVESHLH